MKKILYLSIILLMGLTFTACEDWLDMPSESKYDVDKAFENLSRAEMAVVGEYSNTFNREFYYQFGMGTDECFSTEGETNSKNQVANYVYSPSTTPMSTYTSMYTGIENSNICIKKILLMEVPESQKKRRDMILGEAYAMRAMNYLNIIRFYGDVPNPRIPTLDAGTFTSSRVSRDTIYDYCIEDLKEAIRLLPWKSEGMVPTTERFTKNAAYGILARTALYAAGYSLRWDLNSYSPATVKLAQRNDAARIKELYTVARDACDAIVTQNENDLMTSFESVFRNLVNGKLTNQKESLLEYGQYGPKSNGSATGYTNGIFAHTLSTYGKSQPAMHSLATYWYDFEEGDLRRDVTICNYGIAADSSRQMNNYAGNTIGKFRVDWKDTKGTAINMRDINFPVLRYSDVLLMYAEVENELNNGITPIAKWAYEKVRARGFGNDISKIGITPSSYAEFKKAIINERKLELGFEGLRRTDLIRWGILYEALTETKQNVIDMANKTGKYSNIDLYRAYKKVKAIYLPDPIIAVPYISYQTAPTAAEKAQLAANGYTLLEMHGSVGLSFAQKLDKNAVWIVGLFRGLEKNKVELLPLSTTTIDVNTGLKGQQHPLY